MIRWTLSLLAASALSAQFPLSIELDGEWRMSAGDQPAYARPDFDDRAWARVRLPWERPHGGGTFWLRRSVRADGELIECQNPLHFRRMLQNQLGVGQNRLGSAADVLDQPVLPIAAPDHLVDRDAEVQHVRGHDATPRGVQVSPCSIRLSATSSNRTQAVVQDWPFASCAAPTRTRSAAHLGF